nr:hypothetical protein OG409_26330 [Streptomyces sp. NBC_00974]
METITRPAAPPAPAARYRRLEPALFSLLVPAIGWYDHVHARGGLGAWACVVYLLPLGFALATWFSRDRGRRIALGIVGCVLASFCSELAMAAVLFAWALHGVP